jgi:putative inorganic carbon (HCO3(-)) transporter
MALYFTNSRGGYLAFIAILIYFAITLWGLLKGSVIGAFLFSASLVFAPSRMADISPHGQSASGRIDAWIEGLAMLKSRPVFGVGFLNFDMYHERAAHSAFVNCMAELGLVGYFIWIALLYASFTGLKALEKSETYTPYRKYARILKLSLVGFIASAFFLSQTYTPVLYMLLALITLAVYNPESSLKIPRVFSAKDFLRITAITTASIAMFKILAMVYI